MSPTAPTAGQLVGGRYRLVQQLARGGMAGVWEGRDEVLARPVAIKILHPHLAADAAARERFRREAVAAARLIHPNIVATYDAATEGDTAYIVMELIRGRDLRDELQEQGGCLPGPLAAAYGASVCEALAVAHGAGLIHRDVKPANILLCDGAPSAQGSVKVADFGIARTIFDDDGEADLTEVGEVLGTAKYLSPEQARGETPDARSDLYSLGIVLYELVCGRPPFAHDTAMATALAHVSTEPLRPRQVRPGVSRELEAVLLKAMAKDPGARHQSAAELRADLLAVAGEADPEVDREDDEGDNDERSSFRQSERSWLVPAALIGVAAVALVLLSFAFGRSDVGRDLLTNRRGPAAAAPSPGVLTVSELSVLDETDGREKNDLLPLALDADPATMWRSDTYSNRQFGNLKRGLGLVLRLERPAELGALTVRSPTRGWDAAIYVADQPAPELAGWGDPVATATGLGGDGVFSLQGRRAGAVLLWVTQLGEGNRLEIGGLSVAPR